MKELNFTNFDLLEMYKLKNINRYNTRTCVKHENVAEHTFFTALITLKLCERLKVTGDTQNKCLIKALLHDLPEIELNDITYDAKIKLGISQIFKIHEDEYFKENFPEHYNLMKNDDDDNFVNLVVNYADVLSSLQYVLNEINLGNKTLFKLKREMVKRVNHYKQKLKDYCCRTLYGY